MLADGKIYITNEEGLTSVIKAGPKFEVLAENALNDYCLSSPAISDGPDFPTSYGLSVLHRRDRRSASFSLLYLVVHTDSRCSRRSFSIHV